MKYILLLLIITTSITASAQTDNRDTLFGIMLGGGYTNVPHAEVGVSLINVYYTGVPGNINTLIYQLSNEFIFDGETMLYAPKLSVSFTKLLFSGKLSYAHYTDVDFEKSAPAIIPSVGFGVYGLFTFYYGYLIHVNDHRFNNINNHNFSIDLNLPVQLLSKERRERIKAEQRRN